MAAVLPGLRGAVAYYGPSPDSTTLAHVAAPVLGLYGSDDARVNATVPGARAALAGRGRRFETETYEGAGHGFLRDQAGREGANRRAAERAWPRTVAFLREVLGS
jgi:carboxymethylenebutenolidase